MKNRVDVTVPMEESEVEVIHEQLDYGDSRAEWIRETIRLRLEAEGVDVSAFEAAAADS